MKKFIILFSFLFVSVSAFAVSDKIYKELTVFTKVIQMVDQYYVEGVDEEKLIQGALKGMLLSLDPHTVYLPAETYKDFKSDTQGRFGGVGMEVTVKDNYVTVIAPIEDTPAYRSGIRAGDKILKIDGESTKGMSLIDAVDRMRGPIGKRVKLTVYHVAHNKVREVSVKRALIKPDPIKFEDLKEGYGYFRIKTFQDGVAKALKRSIQDFEKAQKANKGRVKGLILDMRGNPGGLLNEAVDVVDLFVKKGVIVSTKGRVQEQEYKRAKARGTLKKYPMAVLIDGGSASASEIVAGALQDHKRAKIFGTQSFGKGSVQTVFALDGGDALKITIARYFTPKNRMIDGKGIEPDVVLNQDAFRKSLKKKTKEGDDKASKRFVFSEYLEFQKQTALKALKR